MRLATPRNLRELAAGLRGKNVQAFESLAEVFGQCAAEIESRNAEIEGLKLALSTAQHHAEGSLRDGSVRS